MPIHPIDIVKSQEASQLKQMDHNKNMHEHTIISRNFQNTIRQEQTKTVQTAKSDNNDFRYDAKEKSKNSYFESGSKKKEKDKKEENKKNLKDPPKQGGIDILI
jgi:hypothetical protein